MSDKQMLEVAVRALENIRHNCVNPWGVANDAIKDLVDICNSVKCLRDALKFWEEECQHRTTLTECECNGERQETHNLFHGDPEWVTNARKILTSTLTDSKENPKGGD
jgi:hypothetical protein